MGQRLSTVDRSGKVILSRSLLLAVLFVIPLGGDEIIKRDGKKITGRLVREGEDEVTILTLEEEEVTVSRSEVAEIHKGPTALDEYDEKVRKKPPKTASDHVDLGKWCKKKGLKKKAQLHFSRAVELDPDEASARKELGHVRVGEWWVPKEEQKEAEKRWKKEQERLAKLIPWSCKITYDKDIPADWYEKTKFRDRMMDACVWLWYASWGQIYLKEIVIEDRASKQGNFYIDVLDQEPNREGQFGSGPLGGPIAVGGLVNGGTIIHEMMHIVLYVDDEYGCPKCLMTQIGKENFPRPFFCDDAIHDKSKRGQSCWAALKKKYPSIRVPPQAQCDKGTYKEPPEEWGAMPAPKIVIRDK